MTSSEAELKLEEVGNAELSGIAKKMSLELEKLPCHSHGAVVAILTTLLQHRQSNLKFGQVKEEQAVYLKQQALADAERERQAKEQARKDSGLILATK